MSRKKNTSETKKNTHCIRYQTSKYDEIKTEQHATVFGLLFSWGSISNKPCAIHRALSFVAGLSIFWPLSTAVTMVAMTLCVF